MIQSEGKVCPEFISAVLFSDVYHLLVQTALDKWKVLYIMVIIHTMSHMKEFIQSTSSKVYRCTINSYKVPSFGSKHVKK